MSIGLIFRTLFLRAATLLRQPFNPSRKPKKGDILYTVTGWYRDSCSDRLRPAILLSSRGFGSPQSRHRRKVSVLDSGFRIRDGSTTQDCSRSGPEKTVSLNSLRNFKIPLPSLKEQRRIVAELDAEAEQIETVRSLIPYFQTKIQSVLERIWGNNGAE